MLGSNEFLAKAVAEGESSEGVARHLWIYDTHKPVTTVLSGPTSNGADNNTRLAARIMTYEAFSNDTVRRCKQKLNPALKESMPPVFFKF